MQGTFGLSEMYTKLKKIGTEWNSMVMQID